MVPQSSQSETNVEGARPYAPGAECRGCAAFKVLRLRAKCHTYCIYVITIDFILKKIPVKGSNNVNKSTNISPYEVDSLSWIILAKLGLLPAFGMEIEVSEVCTRQNAGAGVSIQNAGCNSV